MIKDFMQWTIFQIGSYSMTPGDLFSVLLILFAAWIILWFLKKVLKRSWKKRGLNLGSQYAIFQIIRYVVWVIAIIIALETAGIRLTIVLAGSAALLVGVGLGIQQTFNDFLSGLILLFEGTIRVDDIIEVEGLILKVRQIGIRTSMAESRADKVIIIPNSKIVNNSVINWTRNDNMARFEINVGVAYGSDVDQVSEIIVQSAKEHPYCFSGKIPIVRLVNFGDSSLDFKLLFWSQNLFRIEQTKSEIRMNISKRFADNHIQIPFPQRDLHIRGPVISQKR